MRDLFSLLKAFKRFWTLIPAYMFFIIAFAVSLSILFPSVSSMYLYEQWSHFWSTTLIHLQERPYATLPRALVKVIIMMVGEIEYKDAFYGESQNGDDPFVGHLLYALFVIIVVILLMNLLTALTVSDIQVSK